VICDLWFGCFEKTKRKGKKRKRKRKREKGEVKKEATMVV
jgi:hypothetical protein